MAGVSESPEGEAFPRTLSALKERGSNLLIVGTTYDIGHAEVCERLLGEPDFDRRRFLVRTDGKCSTIPDHGSDTLHVVEQRAPGIEPRGPGDQEFDRSITTGTIDELECATIEGFTAFEGETRNPDPGELRLCVDSLRPLLVRNSGERVRRFVDAVGTHVARSNGMGHFHLPTRSNDRYVSLLTPVVDAVVQVRIHDGVPQQRWHVFDGAVDSGWLSL